MDISVELQATCAALGYKENNVYHKEPDCLETIKDLIRFLRREDESCLVRLQLGSAQIVQNDLIPIIKQYPEDKVLLDAVLRLLVNLTQPAALNFLGHVPGDKERRKTYLELEGHLHKYKEVMADEDLMKVLAEKLSTLLNLDWEHRHEEDRLLMERILILVRNAFHVPKNPEEQRTDDDASVHDQLVWAVHVSGFVDMLLYVASSDDEHSLSMHVLEIISLMFKEQTPEQLASAGSSRPTAERKKDQKELSDARLQEQLAKRLKQTKTNSRHSNFGGTFVLSNIKSISENSVIYHRSINQVKDVSFDHHKKRKRIARNRLPVRDTDGARRSTLSIRLVLREFCVQFLENCYNPLMRSVKHTLDRARREDHDEMYYLWAMRFFMAFDRLAFGSNMRVDLVSETVSVDAFYYIHKQMTNYHETMLTEKSEAKIWARRMHTALRAYHEMLKMLNAMDNSGETMLVESSKVIKGNIFYTMEYRDVFLALIKKFNESRQSRAFLQELVEATHLFLKMLEAYCARHSHLVVQKKKKKNQKRKKKNNAAAAEADLDEVWVTVSRQLTEGLYDDMDLSSQDDQPFDPAADLDQDGQKAQAIYRVQRALRNNAPLQGLAIFRAARAAFPESPEFGGQQDGGDFAPEDEFLALEQIFRAQLPGAAEMQQPEENSAGEEEDTVEQPTYESIEQEFNFRDFVSRFAQHTVVHPYTLLLMEFKQNSAHTNHCLVKMLHRISVDLSMVGFMFQARLFRVFQKLLCDPTVSSSIYKELKKFAAFVVRKFVETAANNSKIFIELFFFKNVKEVNEIRFGYGSFTGKTKTKISWTEEQEDELRRLYEEFKDRQLEGEDVVELVRSNLIDQTRTRRQVLKQLKYLDILENTKQPRRRGWGEADEKQLVELYQKFKEHEDPVNLIIAQMSKPRSRQAILTKLIDMGLIQDKSEMRKRKKGSKGTNPWERGKYDAPIIDDWSDEDENDNRKKNEATPGPSRTRNESESSVSNSNQSSSSSSDSDSESDGEKIRPKPAATTGRKPATGGMTLKIQKAARKAVSAGWTGAVEWLKNCLLRMAEDQEEDEDDQNIPLVPLSDEQESAMDDRTFHTLLTTIGIMKPANEQESFWRIPGRFKAEDLRLRAAALEAPAAPPSNQEENQRGEANSRKETLKKLAEKKKMPKKRRRSSTSSDDVPEQQNQSHQSNDRSSPTVSNHRTASPNSTNQDVPAQSANEDSDSSMPTNPNSTIRSRVSSSDSDVGSTQNTSRNSRRTKKKKRVKVQSSQSANEDSDSSVPTNQNSTLRSRDSSSDSDADRSHNTSKASKQSKKKQRVKRPLSDSSESDDNRLFIDDEPSSTSNKRQRQLTDDDEERGKPKTRIRAAILDSDDSDKENESENVEKKLDTFQATALSAPLDTSDSDLDDHVTIQAALAKNQQD